MSMTIASGSTVAGRFRLNHLLGRGGMGSIWHATHLGLETDCALKFIEGTAATMPEAQARFQREAKAAAQLRSSNVVQILDHGVWNGVPFIAMELLEGEDLGKRLQRVGRLAPAELCRILNQVCRALSKAHSMGIVHRDLKPDNVFLVREDDREIVKVLDFGIAKDTTDLTTATQSGALLGTPHFMSPEQAQGQKIDARADLWAIAVIAYTALTGQLPFRGEALGELFVKIIVAPIPVPSAHAPVPPGFDAWFAKAASRDPAMRYQTAKELSDALHLACGLSQASETTDVRTPPPILEPPRLPAIAPTTGAPMTRTHGPTPPPSAPRSRGWLALSALLAATLIVGVLVTLRVRTMRATSGDTAAGTTNPTPPVAPIDSANDVHSDVPAGPSSGEASATAEPPPLPPTTAVASASASARPSPRKHPRSGSPSAGGTPSATTTPASPPSAPANPMNERF